MFEFSEIRRLLDAFEASDWEEVHLVADGVELHVSAGDQDHAPVAATPPARAAAAPTPPPPPAVGDGAASAAAPATGADPAQAVPAPPPASVHGIPEQIPDPGDLDAHGLHAALSPSPGIFWRSPAPGEPPFTDVGQTVSPETPIGIVEVMKLMNQVLAGAHGTVKAVVVENGGRVDRDQALVLIEPDA